ncbi:MAG TPA: glutamate racemase [Sporosarcina sp.]|nr:glutamate racemase [Sporosarcina sp.]
MNQAIGVIDSGVGGLTVVKELLQQLPNESIIYIGDNKRCPYGTRSEQEVLQFTLEMVEKLAEMNIKLLVIACNTATAVALEAVQQRFDMPVIGVIVPGARAALMASSTNEIAVLGTTRTIESNVYKEEIQKQCPEAVVYSLACPEFVPIVESGLYQSEASQPVIQKRLAHLAPYQFDAAILGCTHYPLIEHHIQKSLPAHVKTISSAIEAVKDVTHELDERELFQDQPSQREWIFYTTGDVNPFKQVIKDWLQLEQATIQQIEL